MGLQFHETMYGRRFFEKQLPDLTKAINRLVDALPAASAPADVAAEIPHRQRLLLFQTLELLRKEIRPKFHDWKDADDWLFAQLDITQDELAQIYDGREVVYYDGSAVKNR